MEVREGWGGGGAITIKVFHRLPLGMCEVAAAVSL